MADLPPLQKSMKPRSSDGWDMGHPPIFKSPSVQIAEIYGCSSPQRGYPLIKSEKLPNFHNGDFTMAM